MIRLSAFADEISLDLGEQLEQRTREVNSLRDDKEKQRLDGLRDQVEGLDAHKRIALEQEDWANAKMLLSRMLAKLESVCRFGCVESEDLRRWIEHGPPAS